MAAGLGFKTFTTGEVLTAGDVNGYLMQGINVFTNATARDAAITAPAEGQFAFTKDNNSLWYYDGAAWVASGATGDIEGVTAGVGISGGGTSGTVTVTNSMATAIDAKGDLVPGTGADTFARLAVGANNTVLTADSAEATGLKWATPSTGALTVVKSETSFTSVTEIIADSVFSSTYSDYLIEMYWTSSSTSLLLMNLRAGGTNTTTNYNDQVSEALGTSIGTSYVTQPYVAHAINGSFYGSMRLNLFSPNKAEVTNFQSDSVVPSGGYTSPKITQMYGFQTDTTQFTGIRLYVGNGAITGRYTIYGLGK